MKVKLSISLFLLITITLSYGLFSSTPSNSHFSEISDETAYGFEVVSCWFTPEKDWPETDCYHMHVPEDHSQPERGKITFPVIVFRSSAFPSNKPAVLHLGAGGPGAPMYLDSTFSVRTIWEYHDELSLKQGRDLFAIDPRGSGLSSPLLTCDTFVDNVLPRMQRNLSLEQEWQEVDQDYFDCIEKFQKQGVNLAAFNSLSIANDIELMRQAAKVDQWVLIGVSYAATYAQIIANEFPETVKAMILDSATFPNLKLHHNYTAKTLAPYQALYNSCPILTDCKTQQLNIEKRIWELHKKLNSTPLTVPVTLPESNQKFAVTLNGERFLSALMEGTYGESIFKVLPQILTELEAGQTQSIIPYLENYLAFLLDRSYGDISASSHFCYEDKPFTDYKLVEKLASNLPSGYIRETSLLAIKWPDYCSRMRVFPGDFSKVASSIETAIPTLFLHGELDTITPLDDVISQRKNFKNNHLIIFPVSHDVISSEECAEYIAGKFVNNTGIAEKELTCS